MRLPRAHGGDMDRVGAGTDRIARFLEIFITTALPAYIFLYLLFFFGVAWFWILIFEHFAPDLQGDISSTTILDAIAILIGFVYFIVLDRAMKGYTVGPRQYRKFASSVQSLGDMMFGMYGDNGTDQAKIHLRHIKEALQAMAFYSYRLFAPVDTATMLTPEGRIEFLTSGEVFSEEIIVQVLQKGTYPMKLMRDFYSYIYGEFKRMENLKAMGHGDFRVISGKLETIYKILLEIDVDSSISDPTIFYNHLLFIFLVYFGVWLPVTMWIRFNITLTVILYPFIMFIFIAPIIYRQWLGNPFDPKSPLQFANYQEWRRTYVREIEDRYRMENATIHAAFVSRGESYYSPPGVFTQ